MKKIALIFLSTLLWAACKNDLQEKNLPTKVQEETNKVVLVDTLKEFKTDIDITPPQRIELKHQQLVEKEDEKDAIGPLLKDERFLKETDSYVLDFNYPFLNEAWKPTHQNFNHYISKEYLNISEIEAQILEDKELLCDTLRIHQIREKRLVNYKVYQVNEQLLSVLFYKENYYSGAMHPAFTFDCLNFDLERGVFMTYEDFFIQGSEEELRNILNETLSGKIQKGDVFYDCWDITSDDFFRYKNNFVVDDQRVEYYFEDCVICPSYTGQYSVEIPLEKLLPVLRRYHLNPLKF